jgi:eukaryotic-like serine/threonine-protein kinase
MSELWAKWQGQVINGVFPLRRLLGYSDHSGVFLTEFKAGNVADAALKLVPAAGAAANSQLALWQETAALSHPHLIRLFESGRCELGGLQFIFVVMDYADQTLAQILPQRALTPDEVREMLRPTLAGLGFLHRRHLIHGGLKPSNILVVGDRLKLASDTIRRVGDAAEDISSLGATLFEALTQHPPGLADHSVDPDVATGAVPETLAGMVQRCMNTDPADRPTVADLESQLEPVPESAESAESAVPEELQVPQVPQSPVQEAPGHETPVPEPPAPRGPATSRSVPSVNPRWFAAVLLVMLAVLLIFWIGMRRSHPPLAAATAPIKAADSEAAPSPDSARAASPAPAPAPAPGVISRAVLHEEIPDVSRGARDTIRGRIKVGVRVTVDSAGSVTQAVLESPARSRYFDHMAAEAAKQWKFAPAADQESRQWLLRFEFSHSGTAAHASAVRP